MSIGPDIMYFPRYCHLNIATALTVPRLTFQGALWLIE
jgi:hypothetical protein